MAKLQDDFPHAGLLIDAGYSTEAKVRNSSDEDLLAINHIGPDALAKIRAAQGVSSEETAAATNPDTPFECTGILCGHTITAYPCAYCGHNG